MYTSRLAAGTTFHFDLKKKKTIYVYYRNVYEKKNCFFDSTSIVLFLIRFVLFAYSAAKMKITISKKKDGKKRVGFFLTSR